MSRKSQVKRNIFIYMAFVFLSNLSFMSPFLSMFVLSKHISLSMVSMLFFVYQFSKFVFEIPTGFISDKYGRKMSGIIGMVILILSNAFLLFNNIEILFLSFFVKGLGITFISGSIESLFVESVNQDELIKYNVIERLVFYTSLAFSAAVGGVIIQYCGYVYTLVIDMLTLLITLLLICRLNEERVIIRKESVRGIHILYAARKAFANKCVFIFLFIDFANAFAYVAVEDFYSPFLEGLGISSSWIGFVVAIQFLVSSLFGFFVPKITARFSRSKILYVLPVLRSVITMIIYIGIIPKVLIPVIFLLQLILFAIYAPIKYQAFQKSIDSEIRSTTLSMQSLMVSFGSMLFFILSSVLSRVFSISIILIVALIVTTAMLIGALKMLKKQHIAI